MAFFIGFNLFIVVNLALGFLISTVARNQMQAMQLSFFTILPVDPLSGFMFPFAGMPGWAQFARQAVPATHLSGHPAVMLEDDVADVGGEFRGDGVISDLGDNPCCGMARQTLD